MTINRWGQNIKRGCTVMVQPANGERYLATVKYIEQPDVFSRAYGRQAMLNFGYSVCIDDCSLAAPRDFFREALRTVQRASDRYDANIMLAIARTSLDYTGRKIAMAFMGFTGAETYEAAKQDKYP
jgi:hypothetical protein